MEPILGVLAVLALLVFPAIADADSGGATISALPESGALQGHAEVTHECPSRPTTSCYWYGEAAAYSASVACPSTFDLSHGVWVGKLESGPGSDSGTFAFSPYGLADRIVLCLYVNAEGTSLVGQSHPFSRSAGREVLPAAEPLPSGPPYASRTGVWVTVHRCSFVPHVVVNGEKNIGGNIATALYKVGRHNRLRRLYGGTYPVEGGFTAGEEPNGTYRFAARFLDDEDLLPSRRTAGVVFHIKHC
jgi:hypothetical protein